MIKQIWCEHFNTWHKDYCFKGTNKAEILGSAWVKEWNLCPICGKEKPKGESEMKNIEQKIREIVDGVYWDGFAYGRDESNYTDKEIIDQATKELLALHKGEATAKQVSEEKMVNCIATHCNFCIDKDGNDVTRQVASAIKESFERGGLYE